MIAETSIYSAYAARNALRLLRPYDVAGARKVRVGRPFDGGYVMIDAFDGVEAAYSFGINDDVSWDFDIALRDIDVFQYDHTIDNLPLKHPRFHWKKVGIGAHSTNEFRAISDIVKDHKHEKLNNLLLKCDIELAEWDALVSTPKQILSKFSQIVIEIHDLPRVGIEEYALSTRQALANLTNSHHVVHVHANNYGGVRMVGGICLPNVVELTLLRKDMGTFTPSTLKFPTEMDMPCNREWADYYLGDFTF